MLCGCSPVVRGVAGGILGVRGFGFGLVKPLELVYEGVNPSVVV